MIKRKYTGQKQGQNDARFIDVPSIEKWIGCPIRVGQYFKVPHFAVRIHPLPADTKPDFSDSTHSLLSVHGAECLYLQLEDRACDSALANQTIVSPGYGSEMGWVCDLS